MIDVQKAAYSKRLFAFLADAVLVILITSGLFLLLSAALRTDSYIETYKTIIKEYEEKYSVSFGISSEDYGNMTEAEKDNYKAAVDAANSDEEANKAVKTYYKRFFICLASGVIVSVLLVEFVVPFILKDGRTPGKKLFGLGVIRNGCIRISAPVLFIRAVIGKGIFEILLPAFILFCIMTNIIGFIGIVILVIFIGAETVSLIRSGGSALLHDVLTDTVVIDWNSQRIFNNTEERDDFIKMASEEAAEHDPYQ